MRVKRSWQTIVGVALLASVVGCKNQGMRSSPKPSPSAAGSMQQARAQAEEEPVLTTAQTEELGPYLADESGRALYLLEGEPENQSTCYEQCMEAWPPFLAAKGVQAEAPAIREDKIGLIERQDGSQQVTYDGHPLYYYAKDAGEGQATGQDVTDKWGEWYLVTPEGEPLEEHH